MAVPVEQRLVAQEPGEKIESGTDPGQGRVVARGKFLWLGEREVLRPGRHVRDVRARRGRRPVPGPRDGRARLRGHGRARDQLGPDLHRAADLAARSRLRARPPRDGRHLVGAARRLPREPREPRVDRPPRPGGDLRHPPATRPCSATRSATRSRPRSCAGTATAASSASSRNLYNAVKAEDPDALVTYVNYPSTEYLELPFLDFSSFNIYLESQQRLRALPRASAQHRRRPPARCVAECGLDSLRNGESRTRRGSRLAGRSRRSRAGCAGAFVFAWTDEWHRGGFEIDDWDFGLTDREREPEAGARRGAATPSRELPFRRSRRSGRGCPWSSAAYNGADAPWASAWRARASSTIPTTR